MFWEQVLESTKWSLNDKVLNGSWPIKTGESGDDARLSVDGEHALGPGVQKWHHCVGQRATRLVTCRHRAHWHTGWLLFRHRRCVQHLLKHRSFALQISSHPRAVWLRPVREVHLQTDTHPSTIQITSNNSWK